ncbi:MAG: hypothetical protein ACKVXR_16245 [Planctomycetota bacterium]
MNEALRWTLVVGCLLLAILEAPHSVLVLVQDLRGPWRAEPIVERPAAPRSSTLQPDGAFASVDPENPLATDHSPSDRLARELAPGKFAFLLAR